MPLRHARLAGALYVAIFVLAPFVFLGGKAAALVPGDAEATAANLLALGVQYRAGMVIEAIIFLIEIVLAAIVYIMLREFDPMVSLAAAFARLAEAVVQGVNLLTSALILFVLGGAGYLAVFSQDQLDALALLFLDANEMVILVWGIFFGFHLALLGHVVHRVPAFPRGMGVLLGVAGAGYLAQSFGTFVWPGASGVLDNAVVVMAVPGELWFAGWLLVRGGRATAATPAPARS